MKYFLVAAVLATVVLGFGQSASAVTIEELLAQIAQLQAQIVALQAQQQNQTQTWCHTFNANMGYGAKGSDFEALIMVLEKEGIMEFNNENKPSEYNEVIGSGVVEFQEKYASEILTPYKLKRGTGYVGASTRAKLNKLYGCQTQTKVCTLDAKLCPDGTYVSRTGPNCEFSDCPTTSTQPSITVTSPNGGETWQIDSLQKVSWTSSNIPTSNMTIVSLIDQNNNPAINMTTVANKNGQGYFIVPSTVLPGQYKAHVKTVVNGTSYIDTSDGYIIVTSKTSSCTPSWNCSSWGICSSNQQKRTCWDVNSCGVITDKPAETQTCGTTQPSITVTSPNGGETWKVGETHNITWTPGLVYNVGCHNYVALQNTNGGTVGIISNGLLTQGQTSLSWNTKDMYSLSCGTGAQSLTATPGTYRIAVIEDGNGSASMPDIKAYSNTFTIAAASTQPSITVTSPNGGETYNLGSQIPISWNDLTKAGASGIWLLNSNKSTVGVIGQGRPTTEISNTFYWDGKTVCQSFSGYVGSNCSSISPGSYIIRVLSNSADSTGKNLTDDSDSYFNIVNYDACRLDKLDGTNITRNAIYDQASCLSQLCDIYGPANLSQTSSKCMFNGTEIKRYTQSTQPSITVTSVGGSDIPGHNLTFAWTATGLNTVDLILKNSAKTYTLATGVPANSGSYSVRIPGDAVLGTYSMIVSSESTVAYGAQFNIVAPAEAAITVTSPNGGELWIVNNLQTVHFMNTGVSGSVYIYLDKYSGSTRTKSFLVGAYELNTSKQSEVYSFNLSRTLINSMGGPGNFKIRVLSNAQGTPQDTSDDYFTVADPLANSDISQNNLASISDIVAKLAEQIKSLFSK